jgi:hypothetical protein
MHNINKKIHTEVTVKFTASDIEDILLEYMRDIIQNFDDSATFSKTYDGGMVYSYKEEDEEEENV